MDAFDVDGEWWLPEAPDEKVAGRLVVTEDGKAELTLIGALRSLFHGGDSVTTNGTTTATFTDEGRERSGVYPRILGIAGSKAFTLEDCFQVHRSTPFLGGLESERVLVSQVFRGAHFGDGEELAFTEISVWMDWLAYWVMRSGIEESIEFSAPEGDPERHLSTTLAIKPLEAESCQGQDGGKVVLGQSYGIAGDSVRERRLTQDFHFGVERDALVPLTTLLEQVSGLQDLVSIGTGRTAAYTEVSLRHPDVSMPAGKGGEPRYLPIEMIARWNTVNDQPAKSLHASDMWFTLPDLGGMSGVERWLAVAAANRSALGRVMATRYSKGMYASDRVFNCAAALEAYDRDKLGGSVNFVDRIKRCAALAGEPFEGLVGDVDAWAAALKDARNDVAHHKARMSSASTEHLFLGSAAYWLFVLCLLRDSSAPTAVFERMVEHSEYRHLKRRLQ